MVKFATLISTRPNTKILNHIAKKRKTQPIAFYLG